MEEQIEQAREYFRIHYPHVHIQQIASRVIAEFLQRPYIIAIDFVRKMDCLYDSLLSQSMCDVDE
jgi:hypothetical protein